MDRKVRGITLVEIVVVLAILSIMAGFVINWLVNQVNRQRLSSSVHMVTQALEEARRMSSSRPQLHGVRIDQDIVEIYRVGNSCSPGTVLSQYQLPKGVVVQNPVVITYDRMGYPRNASCGIGMTSITLKSVPLNSYKTICVNRYGRIRVVEGQSCPN